MTVKTVYADTDAGRLRADHREGDSLVMVGVVHGPAIGWFNLTRFEGGKLTGRTLRKLFAKVNPS